MKSYLNSYTLCFSRPFESAHLRIKATCIEEAMQNAMLISEQRYRWLRFETDIPKEIRAITQIDVCHDGSGETRRWLAKHVQFSFTADKLLHAAQKVVTNANGGDLTAAIRQLSGAIDAVQGGAQ